jgi:nucleoside-diphosphate-sugar epimerase
VRLSYENPIETYETNVIGTLKVFEACRAHNVKAIVNITSDKANENREWVWGYRENDQWGMIRTALPKDVLISSPTPTEVLFQSGGVQKIAPYPFGIVPRRECHRRG